MIRVRVSGVSLGLPVLALLIVAVVFFANREPGIGPPLGPDPALTAEDPAAFVGDEWDRRAARIVDASRGTELLDQVSSRGTEREVVDTLRATAARARGRELVHPHHRPDAPGVLLIRRARHACAAAADAMASDDPTARDWGIGAFQVVESRGEGGPPESGPPYEGPERDAALTALARILTSDPDRARRLRAIHLFERLLPDHDEPSTEEIARALERDKEDEEARTWLLWLLRKRKAPAPVIFAAGMRGYQDHVTVATGIHDLFVEENRVHLEKAYAGGDAIGRAAIGETFYRHQSPMPWAEALILSGLSDPDREVRACFAKGTLVLRPFSEAVRARLEAMADDVPNAAWALSVADKDESEDD